MGKIHDSKDLQTRRTSRSLLAVSLAASLAAFGCTTNLNPGNGTPVRSGSEIRTLPTSGINSGSERAPVMPPPMTSSYTKSEALPQVTTKVQSQQRSTSSIRHTADEAAAIMAGRAALRGRYLGPASPGSSGRTYVSDNTGGFVNPAMLTNPQLTINSSISSPPTAAINSGAGGNVGVAATATGTTAAATIAGNDVTTTGATSAAVLPAGAFAAARPAVTDSISSNPAVTAASAGNGVVATGTTTTAASTATPTTTAASSGGVRIVRGSTGVTITNASSSSRSQ